MSVSPYRDADERAATIAGLRALAAFLESHPEVPLQRYGNDATQGGPACADVADDQAARAEVDRVACALGVKAGPTPGSNGHHYGTEREFGPWGSGVRYRMTAITTEAMARWRAERSYHDNVHPDATEVA